MPTDARTTLRESLARPDAFPSPRPARVDVEETHASWVFLGDRDVYKVKKPVNFGFLDYSTLDLRKRACAAEVALNGRLAPDVYRGVVAVRRRADGSLGLDGGDESDAAIVDWAVHMTRMPDDARADHRLLAGRLPGAIIDRVADRIAAFHSTAPSDARTAACGSVEAVGKNVVENFAQTRGALSAHVAPAEAREIEEWQLDFLGRNVALFEARISAGRVRDGHGDLRLEHVYVGAGGGGGGEGDAGIDGAITILDCIEFNERFRFADVCADVAFLSMDLSWHQRVDLAERLLARYAQSAGDYDLYALVDFYASYRAFVRGKVSTMLAADDGSSAALRSHAEAEARRYFLLALTAHRRALVGPSLVCIGGLIASGKSTIANAIALEMSAPVVSADRTRKEMLHVEPTVRVHDPAWKGAYDPAFTDTVYAEVLRRAAVVLDSGRPAIVDASFRSAAQREAAIAIARARRVPIRFVECRADADVSRARLMRREKESGVSDGRLAIEGDFRARFEAMTELRHEEHVVVETTRELEATLAEVRGHVKTWPRGLAG
jgi:aminoglycoside phosphotransferase family enzyme/predicted kinase